MFGVSKLHLEWQWSLLCFKVTQQVTPGLGISYYLHNSWMSGVTPDNSKTPQNPSSSYLNLPRMRMAPKATLQLNPFEMLYGSTFLKPYTIWFKYPTSNKAYKQSKSQKTLSEHGNKIRTVQDYQNRSDSFVNLYLHLIFKFFLALETTTWIQPSHYTWVQLLAWAPDSRFLPVQTGRQQWWLLLPLGRSGLCSLLLAPA